MSDRARAAACAAQAATASRSRAGTVSAVADTSCGAVRVTRAVAPTGMDPPSATSSTPAGVWRVMTSPAATYTGGSSPTGYSTQRSWWTSGS